MNAPSSLRPFAAALLSLLPAAASPAAQPDLATALAAVRSVGTDDASHAEALAALRQLTAAGADRLPEVLAGMNGAEIVAVNWLRSAAETIAARESAAGGRLPIERLESFVADRSNSPRARSLAYELVLGADPDAKSRWLPRLLDDPSLELRREGVAHAMEQAVALASAGKQAESITALRRVLDHARDRDQVDEVARRLRDFQQPVDLPRHFGFVTRWQLIGPFDNTGMRGFDVVYGPELQPVDGGTQSEFEGKSGKVAWTGHATADPYGMVDLNQALGKNKGAIAYARAEFLCDAAREVELRLGCVNANKLWLNGDLLTSNEVYHSGSSMDQYTSRGRLKPGKNVILLKIAENEQTESWAQEWQFQLRVCDETGAGILSADRGI